MNEVSTKSAHVVDDRGLAPFPTPCPDWCAVANGSSRYPAHLEYEAWDGHPQRRAHEGPAFGAVEVVADELLTDPGTLHFRALVGAVSVEHEAALRQLARDAQRAALWIEARR